MNLVLIGLAVLIGTFLILSALQYFGVLKIPFLGKLLGGIGLTKDSGKRASGPRIVPEETLERPDPESYMTEHGSVLNRADAKSSAAAMTEADACRAFAERGFSEYPVVAFYDMNGRYIGEREASISGTDRHPYYQTYFASDDGILWSVMVVNGVFMAEPFSYNAQGYWRTPHMLSERATIQNYDGSSNTYYEISPDSNELFLKTVTRIDAKTLSALDYWEVDER